MTKLPAGSRVRVGRVAFVLVPIATDSPALVDLQAAALPAQANFVGRLGRLYPEGECLKYAFVSERCTVSLRYADLEEATPIRMQHQEYRLRHRDLAA